MPWSVSINADIIDFSVILYMGTEFLLSISMYKYICVSIFQ